MTAANSEVPAVRGPSEGTLEVLATLIGFPTVSRDPNLGLIEWVRDRLVSCGVSCRLTYDTAKRKANLFATLGEAVSDGGIVLSGHTDVVPVDGQEWTTEPFKATIAAGRMYGRGAADMKGFIAVVLAAVPKILGRKRATPIHLALSYDEEVGCLGARKLIQDVQLAGVRPNGCIIGEPTGMVPVIGHKGANAYRCGVRGLAAHSSLAPHGVNAIEYATRLIAKLQEIAQRLRRSERAHAGYAVPHTTLNIGYIGGGMACNVVPDRCEFKFDIRNLPGTEPNSIIEELERFAATVLLPEMRANAEVARISIDCMAQIPPLEIDSDAPLPRWVLGLLGTGVTPTRAGFGTEAGLFQAAGIPAVVCGPGSIEQAHRPDEYVSFEQLSACESFLQKLIDESNGFSGSGAWHDGGAPHGE